MGMGTLLLPGQEISWGKRGDDLTLERKRPLQRGAQSLSWEAEGLEHSQSCEPPPPTASVLAPPPFPCLQWQEQGDQKELPAGQEGGQCLVCANPGPEVFRGTWETSRRGRQSCTADELISQHPHPPTRRRAGSPVSLAAEAAEKRLSLSFLPFGTSISLSQRFSRSDTSHRH